MTPKTTADAVFEAHLDSLRHPDPSGTSLVEFLHAVEAHVEGESASIEAYRRMLHESTDRLTRLVLRLLLEDEAHHHTLLLGIAEQLRDELAWAPSAQQHVAGHPASVQEVHALEQEERQGAHDLRQLAQRHRTECEGLPSLLLEAMAMDSEKHARLLSFVAQRIT